MYADYNSDNKITLREISSYTSAYVNAEGSGDEVQTYTYYIGHDPDLVIYYR